MPLNEPDIYLNMCAVWDLLNFFFQWDLVPVSESDVATAGPAIHIVFDAALSKKEWQGGEMTQYSACPNDPCR